MIGNIDKNINFYDIDINNLGGRGINILYFHNELSQKIKGLSKEGFVQLVELYNISGDDLYCNGHKCNPLLDSVLHNNYDVLHEIVNRAGKKILNCSVLENTKKGENALYVAQNFKMIKTLISLGADINMPMCGAGFYNWSPLIVAIWKGQWHRYQCDKALCLIAHGAECSPPINDVMIFQDNAFKEPFKLLIKAREEIRSARTFTLSSIDDKSTLAFMKIPKEIFDNILAVIINLTKSKLGSLDIKPIHDFNFGQINQINNPIDQSIENTKEIMNLLI